MRLYGVSGTWGTGCLLFVLTGVLAVTGVFAQELPTNPEQGRTLILLQAEPQPGVAREAVRAYGGQVVGEDGAGYVSAEADRVVAGHEGLGAWGVRFRYAIEPGASAGEYTFWARWMQGGEPEACPQTFTVLAGPSADRLEQRGAFRLVNYSPWKLEWVHADEVLALKADDKVIEIHNAGQGQDAKVFDAFLLSPGTPPAGQVKRIAGEVSVSGAGDAREAIGELPSRGNADKPQILLQAGSGAASPGDAALAVYTGEVADHEGDRGIEVKKDEVTSLRGGPGDWAVHFRFPLPEGHPSGEYVFWARWKQGGDPRISVQTFEVWAGADAKRLEKRASMSLTPDGWNYVWREGAKVRIKPDDTVVEVRNSGNGQTAKIFSAFLLGGPPPPPPAVELPIQGSAEHPIIALGFGKEPFNLRKPGPAVRVYSGEIASSAGIVKYASISGDEATVAQNGFGETTVTLQFDLVQPIPPGYYGFRARYMSGGEPSQTLQTFTVKAGPDEQNLGVRGIFQTRNHTPFKHQWITGQETLAILPGDKVLQVVNSGIAHDAKVFEGFVLGLERPMAEWMTAERAALRSRWMAVARQTDNAEKRLFILDGPGAGDTALFEGLTQAATRAWVEAADSRYLQGEAAEAMARRLNITPLPAAVVVDGDRKVLGVLVNPKDAGHVEQFLASPGTAGIIPSYAAPPAPAPVQLKEDGSPAGWLVGSNWPGQNGVGRWGVGAEAAQRPNPGDMIAFGYYTAGHRVGHWREQPVQDNGMCVLTEELEDSYTWGKATNYAVLYLQAQQARPVFLHLQHSGIQSAVYLDGVEQQAVPDAKPPFASVLGQEQAGQTRVAERAGQEIHDDVAVVQAAQRPLRVTLDLTTGWHCLVIKMVHAQDKGQRVVLAGKLLDGEGIAPAGVRTQTWDPEAAGQMSQAAAGFWPMMSLEGIPGNLPRPGEALTLVADMRVAPSFVAKWCPEAFLPIGATLRVRMADYDGKAIRTVQASGSFPAVVKLELGAAPEAGYYILTPELVSSDGRLIHRFYPEGFSVVRGNAAQKQRVEKKELMNSWYYAFNDWESFAPWLERIGMFKNVGSSPGVSGTDAAAKWEDAGRRGIVLFGDFAGDSNWMNNDDTHAREMVALASEYTRYFKGINEVDGRFGGEEGVAWHGARNPEKYVERTKWQHEAVHQARTDAIHFGGSVYTSGSSRRRADHPEIPGPREWLRRCLELGLDKYIDAWDVHAYPQYPPRLEAPSMSNSPRESDLGVKDVYGELGIPFTKPLLLGETSAMPFHGFTALRWQADMVAKMTAWTNSREDWMGIALCAAHHKRRKTSEEYGMSGDPGEASIYTAGALIDGLPYKRVATADKEIQAAYFGKTFMIWRADGKLSEWTMSLDGSRQWVVVDVVGRARPLAVQNERASFPISTSPVYVLEQSEYEGLTRL